MNVNLSELIVTHVRSAVMMRSQTHDHAARTNRPCWAVLLKYEGATEYRCGDSVILSDRTHPVLLPAGCSYSWVCTQTGHFASIEFDSPLRDTEIRSFHVPDTDPILRAIRRTEQLRLSGDPYGALESIRSVYDILLLMLRTTHTYTSSAQAQRIAPSVRYLCAHYAENLTNDQLSDVSGISTVYFRKLFTEVYGMSPMRYLHRLRIDKAKELLQSDYTSIAAIAESIGYSNIYHFSKMFRLYTGISPTRFARAARDRKK